MNTDRRTYEGNFTGTSAVPRLSGRALAGVLAALVLVLALGALDQTIVGTALPAIMDALQSSRGGTSVITAYLAVSTAMVAAGTFLSRQYEPKWFLLMGAIIFVLGSTLCSAARTMDQLVAFRAVQGVGAGTDISVTFIALGDIFRLPQRAWWQALFACIFGLCAAVGPIIGGWLTDHGPLVAGMIADGTRWGWIFLLNLPLGLCALAALVVLFPPAVSGPRQPSPRGA